MISISKLEIDLNGFIGCNMVPKFTPKIINELKPTLAFDGSFVAGSIYGKSLPLFVRDTDLILYTPESARLVEQKIPEKNRLKLAYRLIDRSAEMIRNELWEQ